MTQPEQLPGFLLDILNFGASPSGEIAVGETGVAYSNSFPLRRGVYFGWEVQFDSDGDIDVKVELEQSNQRPATEGEADDSWVVPDNKTTAMFPEIDDDDVHNTAYSPNVSAFGRLKFTGLNANAATTKCVGAKVYQIKSV